MRPSQLLPRGLACGRQRCQPSRKDPTLCVVTKHMQVRLRPRRRALPFTTGGVRCPSVVRKHPHVKALTKQLTWKVRHCRSSNYRSSPPETAAAGKFQACAAESLVPTCPSQLKQGLLGAEMLPGVWVPLLWAGRKVPHDGVHVDWEEKGLRKSKARFSAGCYSFHIPGHPLVGRLVEGAGRGCSSVQTNN